MPINPNALADSSPEPDPSTEAVAPDGTELGQSGGPREEEQPKRTRRTKAQMIADAVVPADDEQVDLKDAGTGAKIQRPWLVALEMVREGKAEFADKAMKYAMQKHDQQKAAPVFDQIKAEGDGPTMEKPKSPNIPEDAQPGDEVQVGSETFRVGHGGVLTTSPVEVDPADQPTNGHGGEVQVETQRLPHTQEILPDGSIKLGTGILEKIGLPDYSSLQIGPITISRTVYDDGRRTAVDLDGDRQGEVITAAIEGFELLDNTVEFVARRFRGQLQTFLEATGALKQPVS